MNNFISNKVLENSKFSNVSVGPLAYLIHKLSGEGQYQMEIYEEKKVIHSSVIVCAKDSELTSINIDLSAVISSGKVPASYSLNSEHCYVLFFNSKEYSSNRILIRKGKDIEFDSLDPKKGDLYALNLIKPGEYEVVSKSSKKSIKINVLYPTLQTTLKKTNSDSLNISSKNFKSSDILPNQGFVIEFDDTFNDIEVTLVKENLPKKGQSIVEQLHSRVHDMQKSRKVHNKANPVRKIHKEFKK